MRKILLVVLFSISLLGISSCGIYKEDFTVFARAIKNYNYDKTTGYSYITTQKLSGEVTYKKEVIHKFNKKKPITALTTYYERSLNEFNLENQYSEESYETYYYKDKMGVIVDGEVVWEKKAFKDYNRLVLPKLDLKKKYFISYETNKLGDYFSFKGTLKEEDVKSFFKIDESISNLYVEIRIRGKQIEEIKLVYTMDKSVVEVAYSIYYHEHNIELDVI